MSKSLRTALFFALSACFVIFSTILVFYSQGYQLVFSDGCEAKNAGGCDIRLEKSGGIYIETQPRDVKIKIDGKEKQDASGLIRNGTLIKGLSPKSHEIEIQKDGYFTWYKNLKVVPETVSEITHIILAPKNPEADSVTLGSLRNGIIKEVANDRFLQRDENTGSWYLYDERKSGAAINLSSSFSSLDRGSAKKISFHPYDTNKFVIETSIGIDIFDNQRLQTEQIISSDPMIWTIKGTSVYFVSKPNKKGVCSLSSYNLVLRNTGKIYDFSSCPSIARLEAAGAQNQFAVLEKNGRLSVYSDTDKIWKEIANNAAGMSAFSPDAKKLAFWDKDIRDPEIKIYFIKDWQNGLRKNAGEIINMNLNAFSGDISAIYWHEDSLHLFAKESQTESKKSIIFTEMDDRLPLNYYRVFSEADDFEYNPETKKLYFIQNSKFWEWEI